MTSARSARSRSPEKTRSSTGSADVEPSDTTVRPVSSSLRKSTSSISSPICCTSPRACSTTSAGFAPGSEKLSSNTISRVSGVRSS